MVVVGYCVLASHSFPLAVLSASIERIARMYYMDVGTNKGAVGFYS